MPPMPPPNRAICTAVPKIQRNGGPVCGGAPFNVTNPSNDVQNVNIGVNGFNPKIKMKISLVKYTTKMLFVVQTQPDYENYILRLHHLRPKQQSYDGYLQYHLCH